MQLRRVIDTLYTVIKNRPSILTDIDSDQFVETPLHIAASKGHLPFATEIMNLKPSFAVKLNMQGWSPIHIAMQNQKMRMVLSFVNMNNDLVRVKGRGGWTPLHFATQIGEIDILAEFLNACPDSIEDVTVRGETALHIAVKNNNYEALYLLVCFLRKNTKKGALGLEHKILNQGDEDGNTILHISALNYDLKEMIELLIIKTDIRLNAKNLEGKTALDMSIHEEIKKLLSSAGTFPGSQITCRYYSPTLADKIKLIVTIEDEMKIYTNRIKNLVSDEQRNTWMIIATLLVTATYQSVMSPPGGVYQANAGDSNNNSSSNSTLGSAGTSVMSQLRFSIFSYMNILSFLVSTLSILILSPTGALGYGLMTQMFFFPFLYLYSMAIISPTHYNNTSIRIIYVVIMFVGFIFFIIWVYSRVQLRNYKKKLNRYRS